jgi:hypothetical protein
MTLEDKVEAFMQALDEYVAAKIREASSNDPYWGADTLTPRGIARDALVAVFKEDT